MVLHSRVFNLHLIFLEFTYLAESLKEIHLEAVTDFHELGDLFSSLKEEGVEFFYFRFML